MDCTFLELSAEISDMMILPYQTEPAPTPEHGLVAAVIERALRDWDKVLRTGYQRDFGMLQDFFFSDSADGWTLRNLAVWISDEPDQLVHTIRQWVMSETQLEEKFHCKKGRAI